MPKSVPQADDTITDPGREPFRPLDFPAGYANDVMCHVIEHNCAGCSVPTAGSVVEFGPGGSCEVLAAIFVHDEIPELSYDGIRVTCHVRRGAE